MQISVRVFPADFGGSPEILSVWSGSTLLVAYSPTARPADLLSVIQSEILAAARRARA